MNRNTLIATTLLSLGAGLTLFSQETNAVADAKVVAPDTNATTDLDWSSFQAIAKKNIFDPTRGGTSNYGAVRKPVVVRVCTYRGTMDEVACFTGDGAPQSGYRKEGDLINGFKVLKVALDYVKLAQPNGDIVVLKLDDSLRREEDGPWTKSDQPVTEPASSLEIKVDDAGPSSSSSAGPAGESDILKKLRLRKEQEEK